LFALRHHLHLQLVECKWRKKVQIDFSRLVSYPRSKWAFFRDSLSAPGDYKPVFTRAPFFLKFGRAGPPRARKSAAAAPQRPWILPLMW
jgi:hypothetical protein